MRTAIILFIAAASIFSQTHDTIQTKHHFFGIGVLDLIGGDILLNYEYVQGHHGILIEADYLIPFIQEAYAGSIAYRYHFSKNIRSKFIGLFFRGAYSSAFLPDENNDKWPFTIKSQTIGLNAGKRGILWKKHDLLYTFRIGAGYPMTTLTWEKRFETLMGLSAHAWENIFKIGTALDFELTLNRAF